MRTAAAWLAEAPSAVVAHMRGLVLRQLRRQHGTAADMTVVHMFAVPPSEQDSRLAIYEVTQPLGAGETPFEHVRGRALSELETSHGDPRLIPTADQRWRSVDPDRRGVYLGAGQRVTTSRSATGAMALFRMVDRTAIFLVLTPDNDLMTMQVSRPFTLGDHDFPAEDQMPVTEDPPFLLLDHILDLTA